MPLGKEEIQNRFGFHQARIEGPNASAQKHATMRIMFCEFAEYLDSVLPEGRYKSLTWTQLEDASMWAHKGIAAGDPLVKDSRSDQVCEINNNHCKGVVARWAFVKDDKKSHDLCEHHVDLILAEKTNNPTAADQMLWTKKDLQNPVIGS